MTEQPETEWRYTKTEPSLDELPDPTADDGCKECCSILFGAFSLTGLIILIVPILIKERKNNE